MTCVCCPPLPVFETVLRLVTNSSEIPKDILSMGKASFKSELLSHRLFQLTAVIPSKQDPE